MWKSKPFYITVKAGQAYPPRFYYWLDYLKNESVSGSRIFCQIQIGTDFCMRNEQWISNENFSVLGQIENLWMDYIS